MNAEIYLSEPPYKVAPTTLCLRDEAFVMHYAIEGDVAAAYRAAYPGVVEGAAKLGRRMLNRVEVQARLREHQEAISKIPSSKSAQRLIFELEELVDADPNELISVQYRPCMGCWPANERHEEPNADCQACFGEGTRCVLLADTTKVSPGARRLFKGVELDQYGFVKKLLLHDQMAARVELHKLKGMHIDRSVNLNVNKNLPDVNKMVNDPIEMEKYLESLK
jgi:hypothetical protein